MRYCPARPLHGSINCNLWGVECVKGPNGLFRMGQGEMLCTTGGRCSQAMSCFVDMEVRISARKDHGDMDLVGAGDVILV